MAQNVIPFASKKKPCPTCAQVHAGESPPETAAPAKSGISLGVVALLALGAGAIWYVRKQDALRQRELAALERATAAASQEAAPLIAPRYPAPLWATPWG